MILASWNTAFLLWLGVLIWQRGCLKHRANWFWAIPVVFVVSAFNWLSPELFSLSLVYVHPLIALWFLDKHLARVKREWLSHYRRSLLVVFSIVVVMIWQLSLTANLHDDNGLFWRITQHAGAELIPGVSSHMLVSLHLFLEMLHYAVWLLAIPLITKSLVDRTQTRQLVSYFSLKSIPIAYHSRGFPKMVAGSLLLLMLTVLGLWVGFAFNYSLTRDIYFTIAIAHVLAEAPFLLRTL